MTLAWLKMFVITIHLRSRTFLSSLYAPKHRFFSKFAIFCNIFWWETRTMEKTRSWSVRFRLEMTWIVCHNFHLRNRTSVNLKRVLRYWQRHQNTDFFQNLQFFAIFFVGKHATWKKHAVDLSDFIITWPALAYLDRTAGLGCTVINFLIYRLKKSEDFWCFRFFWHTI